MTTIVLVPGAFHGGWCWRAVAGLLRRDGHEVYTPSLTGLAERSHLLGPTVDLEVHVLDLVNLLKWEALEDVVLVAHSYGGLPATGAADREAGRIAGLVYLDSYTPSDGDSALAVRDAEPGATPLARSDDGIAVLPPAPEVFGLQGALAAEAERLLTPHPLATLTQPLRLAGAWRGVGRKLYIRAAGFPAPYFDRYHAAAAAAPDWAAVRAEKPHNVLMTEPAWLVDQLRRHLL